MELTQIWLGDFGTLFDTQKRRLLSCDWLITYFPMSSQTQDNIYYCVIQLYKVFSSEVVKFLLWFTFMDFEDWIEFAST